MLLLAHFLRDRVNDTLRGAPMFKPGNVLTGDAKAGAAYFHGEGRLHAVPLADRRSRRHRPPLDPVTIQQRFLFPHTRARGGGRTPTVVTVTVTTEAGETLTGDARPDGRLQRVAARRRRAPTAACARTPGTRVVKNDPFAAHVALLSRITDKNIHDVVAYLETLK